MNKFGLENVVTEKANVELTDLDNGVKVNFSGDISFCSDKIVIITF